MSPHGSETKLCPRPTSRRLACISRRGEVDLDGLRLLQERELLKQIAWNGCRREIAIGGEEAEQGKFVDGIEVFKNIRARSAERWAARPKS